MNTALSATRRPTTELRQQLADLARCARRAGTAQSTTSIHPTTLPLGEWLLYLADDLQQHATVLNLPDGDDASASRSTSACPAGELTQQQALKVIEVALEQIGNSVRQRLVSLAPTSLEARRFNNLLQSLDMHWWVCHRAAA